MLKELTNLTLEADARYATSSELEFSKTYLDSVEIRLSAYKKIRDSADEIIEQVCQYILNKPCFPNLPRPTNNQRFATRRILPLYDFFFCQSFHEKMPKFL